MSVQEEPPIGDVRVQLERKRADGSPIRVHVGIDAVTDRTPYFTVTVDYLGGGGADHAAALEAAPEIAELVKLHLANARTGEPMHAIPNAGYFFERGELELAAGSLALEVGELPADVETREELELWARETLPPQWAERARKARELLYELESEEGTAINAGELLLERMRKLPIGGKVLEALGEREDAEGWRHNAYRVAVTSSGRQLFTFTYRAGLALDRPGMLEILSAVLNDIGYLESEPDDWTPRDRASVEIRKGKLAGVIGDGELARLVELAGQQ